MSSDAHVRLKRSLKPERDSFVLSIFCQFSILLLKATVIIFEVIDGVKNLDGCRAGNCCLLRSGFKTVVQRSVEWSSWMCSEAGGRSMRALVAPHHGDSANWYRPMTSTHCSRTPPTSFLASITSPSTRTVRNSASYPQRDLPVCATWQIGAVVRTRYCTAAVDKLARSTSFYHCRQCCILLKPRSDRIDYTVVCFMTHDCRRTLWKRSTTSASRVWLKFANCSAGPVVLSSGYWMTA